MNNDFWGFNDERNLKKKTVNSDLPETILKNQMDVLAEKTGYAIYGVSTVLVIDASNIKYRMATKFDLMVLALDKYKKTLLIMYSNPLSAYPVALTVGKNYEDDLDSFNPDYVCSDANAFNEALKEILFSPDTMNLITLLYSKAKSTVMD